MIADHLEGVIFESRQVKGRMVPSYLVRSGARESEPKNLALSDCICDE